MNWKTIFAVGAILLSGTLYAQTPDGETPANEGVCDDLIYTTPGLYGLCVAFCEAQDCVPDFTLEDPLKVCKPANRKILENYERKMTQYDPPMPCINPPPECPCFSASEVELFVQPWSACFDGAVHWVYQVWHVKTAGTPNIENHITAADYLGGTHSDHCVFHYTDPLTGAIDQRVIHLNQDELKACIDTTKAWIDENGGCQ